MGHELRFSGSASGMRLIQESQQTQSEEGVVPLNDAAGNSMALAFSLTAVDVTSGIVK